MADRRYSAFPEIIEFCAGIDRQRTDVVIRLTEDLKVMNADFLKRTGIHESFNPLKQALWTPKDDSLEKLKKEVDNSITKSALPTVIKDTIADQNYDQAKPYNQALANFINESSLIQMVQAMKGAARALRNSDHVEPNAKLMLLDEVISCWVRVCQILVILSPALANQREVVFEGMNFVLDKRLDKVSSIERWKTIMTVIVDNIVDWFQDDIFSKKMGALLIKYSQSHGGSLGELLVLLVMVKQRPPHWEKEVERFIKREQKNSFYLSKIFDAIRCELEYGFSTERNKLELRRLAGISLAKHQVGVKNPNNKLIEKAVNAIDKDIHDKQGS